MSDQLRRWLTWMAAGLAAGIALGVAIGWWLWPVAYTNNAPDVLRQDYRDEYILMTAAAYDVDGRLDRARERLTLLHPQEPAAPVIELAKRLIEAGGSAEDIARLARMAWALGATAPELTPYLEGQP